MLHGPVIAVDIVAFYLMGGGSSTNQKMLIKTHDFYSFVSLSAVILQELKSKIDSFVGR